MAKIFRETILARARKEVGYKESPANSNRTKYGAWYGLNGEPWCMMFLMWLFYQEGASSLLPGKTASCGQFRTFAKAAVNWHTSGYKIGDILILTFSIFRTPQHCGILESIKPDGTLVIIEGNTALNNQSNGGEVMRRERKPSCVVGAFRPAYADYAMKHIALIAQECADGREGWGTNPERKAKLKKAGYDPDKVQKLINALFGTGIPGKVNVKTYLSARAKPDSSGRETGRYTGGQSVLITEVKEGNDAPAWGRTKTGWISLEYVELQEG